MGDEARSGLRAAVIVASRPDLLQPLIESAGYTVVGVAEHAVFGEQLIRHFTPRVVVVENDLRGETGLASLPTLRAASPASQVLLVVTEDWTPRDLGSTGAFAVVTRSQLSELVTELDGVDRWVADHGQTSSGDDRRSGRDRRHHQDWLKVGWERRAASRRVA